MVVLREERDTLLKEAGRVRDPQPDSGRPAARGIRLLIDGAAPGAWNMAVDEALMQAGRDGVVTVRFYRWDPPCLSLGRNQAARAAFDPVRARQHAVDIVRRPTGGRAIYHDRELTYAVTAPAELWGELRNAYARINAALARGLTGLGVEVSRAPRLPAGRSPRPDSSACFRDPLPGELLACGRKLVGSAQWRDRGALLQHGSLLLVDQQRLTAEFRHPRASSDAARSPASGIRHPPSASIGLSELLSPLPGLETLIEALSHGFRRELGLPVEPARADSGELAEARRLESRYRSFEWTWRR
ncbi:MAG: biotin/lipoate A/B protein ligase family protein [Gemmatimonadota bacterium]